MPQVWDGFQTNIKLMVIAEALVLVFALLVAIVRGLPGRASFPAARSPSFFTDVFRGTPLILVLFIVGLGVPALNIAGISDRSLFFYRIVSLTLVYTAYVTEVYRAASSPCTRASEWRRDQLGADLYAGASSSSCPRPSGGSSRRS